jgi:single-strand DNA-binding protein
VNRITFTGRLAADPETRFTPNGGEVLNFRVASDVGFGDKKSTNWFAVAVFGKRATSLAPHLKKGQEVTIFGQLTLREYQNRDGVKQISPDVFLDDIQMHGGKGQQQAAPATADDDADSIPF